MGELVIYENDMNKLKFGNFTKVSMDFFMALCFFMRDRGSSHLVIPFDELKKKAHYRPAKNHDFVQDLDYMTSQMLEVNSTIIEKRPSGKKRIYKFDLFPTFIIDEEAETLEVAVNERFTWLLNEFHQYTSLELQDIVDFKSKYTKNLFRLIREWKSVGKLHISGADEIQAFREKIGVRDTYSNAEMNRRCIAPAVKEINDSNCSIKNLTYECEYANKRGKPLKSIKFTWNKVPKNEYGRHGITDITTESIYHTVKETLKDRSEFKDGDIVSIAKAAKKHGITDLQVKQRIGYVLRQDNILNPVGYIVTLMQRFNNPVEIKNKFGFEQRDYDYDRLESLLLNAEPDHSDAPPIDKLSDNIKPGETETLERMEKLSDSIKSSWESSVNRMHKFDEQIAMMGRKQDETSMEMETIKAMSELMKNKDKK